MAAGSLRSFWRPTARLIVPSFELIEQSRMAVDDLLEVLGRSTLEAVLRISAANVAGEVHQGKRGGEIVRHSSPGLSCESIQAQDASVSASASLREGLSEMFTINRLGLPPSLRRSLATTNIVESPNSGVRMKTRHPQQHPRRLNGPAMGCFRVPCH